MAPQRQTHQCTTIFKIKRRKVEAQVWDIPLSEIVVVPMTKGLTLDRSRVHVGKMRLVDPKT